MIMSWTVLGELPLKYTALRHSVPRKLQLSHPTEISSTGEARICVNCESWCRLVDVRLCCKNTGVQTKHWDEAEGTLNGLFAVTVTLQQDHQ